MGIAGQLVLAQSAAAPGNQWQRTSTNLLRDSAIGLSVGVSAHLVWDALLSSSKRGFYIRGFGGPNILLVVICKPGHRHWHSLTHCLVYASHKTNGAF